MSSLEKDQLLEMAWEKLFEENFKLTLSYIKDYDKAESKAVEMTDKQTENHAEILEDFINENYGEWHADTTV